jgi:hypothetical protein
MKLLASLALPFLGLEFALGVRKVRRPAPLPSMPPAPIIETTAELVEHRSEFQAAHTRPNLRLVTGRAA